MSRKKRSARRLKTLALLLRPNSNQSFPNHVVRRFHRTRMHLPLESFKSQLTLLLSLRLLRPFWSKSMGLIRERHGLSKTPEYKLWMNVVDRCRNPKNPSHHNYAGRGIQLHPPWEQSFLAFLAGVGTRPSPKHTLERIDNNRGYMPGNVRWATRKEQANNQRKTHFLTYRGETKSLTEWAQQVGLVPSTLQYRVNQGGMTDEQAITTPRRNGRMPTGLPPSPRRRWKRPPAQPTT